MQTFLQYLAGFSIGGITVGTIVYKAFTHPELVEKWASYFYRGMTYINKKYQYKATQNEIQSKINSFVADLSKDANLDPVKAKIRWTAREEDEDIQLEDDEVIIVIRDRGYKNKNFVHAAYFYTSTTLLRHAKRHLSKKQAESLDLYTTKIVIERDNKQALEIFMRDYFQPLLEDSEVQDLIKKYVDIDKSGFYTHILLQELTYLGNKSFLDKKDEAVIIEVKNLIAFLYQFATREVGDVKSPDEFVGKYSRCAIKIVSTQATRDSGKHEGPANRIIKTFESGIENVYVIGPCEDDAINFINKACDHVLQQKDDIVTIKKDKFAGVTRKNKKIRRSDTYFVHLQNPSQSKYLIEEDMLNKVEKFSEEE